MVIWHCPIPKSTTMFTPTYFLLLFTKVLVHNKLETIIKKEKNEKKKKIQNWFFSREFEKHCPWSRHHCPQLTDKKTQLEKSSPQKGLGLSMLKRKMGTKPPDSLGFTGKTRLTHHLPQTAKIWQWRCLLFSAFFYLDSHFHFVFSILGAKIRPSDLSGPQEFLGW